MRHKTRAARDRVDPAVLVSNSSLHPTFPLPRFSTGLLVEILMRVLNSFHDLCQPLRRLGFAVGGSEQHFHGVLVAVLYDQPLRGLGHEEDVAVLISEPLDQGLGHSFCYIWPAEEEQENAHHNLGSLKLDIPREFNGDSQEQRRLINCESTIFKSISGASVIANTSTPLTTTPTKQNDSFSYYDRAAAFESSTSFSAIPLMI